MKKNIILFLLIAAAAAAFVLFADIQSVDEYYLSHIDDIKEGDPTVFLTIRCDTVLDNYDKLRQALRSPEYVPEDGVILARTEYVLRDGDTVFDILERAARHNRIQLEHHGTAAVYIKSINHLYEFDCGPLSGWIYKVNGGFPSGDCSSYVLSDKDEVEWVYTCDLGQDVGRGYTEEAAP